MLLVVVSGCKTHESGGGSHAAVTINGHNTSDVALMARTVFSERGYDVAKVQTDTMIFERPGTKGEAVKFGGWDGKGVTMRVKMYFQDMGVDSCMIRCDAYSVRAAGDTVFEDETRRLAGRKYYQEILDEIKARLEPAPTGSAEEE